MTDLKMTNKRLSTVWMRRLGAALTAGLTLAALNGCGGGDLVESFQPSRILVFGDEASVITSTGAKYSVNALTADTSTASMDCLSNAIWVQALASHYRMGFPQCPISSEVEATPRARNYATAGSGVDGIAAQIARHETTSGFVDTDLVTLLTGQNDIIAAYNNITTVDDMQTAIDAVEAAGTRLGLQVNAFADTGARVLIATVPNQGLTPFGVAEKAAHDDFDRADALATLTERFNAKLRSTMLNDGTKIGLVQLDELASRVIKFAGSYGYTNVTEAACDVTLPNCTTRTLVSGAEEDGARYFWADDLRFGPNFHGQVGTLAIQRATNNPF
ncbi:SGNH/GDSL hydrolase family protein [Caldimonas sp. KR1-144]|uniref:SGNH/GDSL hydrolase family protein n=1 Tax=Caldimonas sp. KR1-144 TaxID=3400911 RepID=UPI003C1060EA